MFGMELNKIVGHDGCNLGFYLFKLLVDFYKNALDIDRLNYGVITLVPKGSDANKIQKYKPICLLNVVIKIITKVLVNPLIKIIKGVISAS